MSLEQYFSENCFGRNYLIKTNFAKKHVRSALKSPLLRVTHEEMIHVGH